MIMMGYIPVGYDHDGISKRREGLYRLRSMLDPKVNNTKLHWNLYFYISKVEFTNLNRKPPNYYIFVFIVHEEKIVSVKLTLKTWNISRKEGSRRTQKAKFKKM